jgi:hypothetical protein
LAASGLDNSGGFTPATQETFVKDARNNAHLSLKVSKAHESDAAGYYRE